MKKRLETITVAKGVLFQLNADGEPEVLVMEKSKGKQRKSPEPSVAPVFNDIPGGKGVPSEPIDEILRRETEEEAGA